jgi:hypothetical protein
MATVACHDVQLSTSFMAWGLDLKMPPWWLVPIIGPMLGPFSLNSVVCIGFLINIWHDRDPMSCLFWPADWHP